MLLLYLRWNGRGFCEHMCAESEWKKKIILNVVSAEFIIWLWSRVLMMFFFFFKAKNVNRRKVLDEGGRT